MMHKIHELTENLSNQIAAGEVIERPASVVKELIENSLDAQSTRIRIDFVDAGLKEIDVQDNGTGISRDQIDLAFTRHATSKINSEHDLFNVATLGFRGEALASIAAVSHTEILTSTDGQNGTLAKFSGGLKEETEPAPSKQGTKITVKDLFYNTPARLKYLRSARTETMKIVDIVNRVALGHPKVAFTLASSDKILLQTVGNDNLRQTVAQVYGRKIAENMFEFSAEDPDFKIKGLISKPELTRSTRNFMSLLLNGRYIKNYNLTSALLSGYGSHLSSKHYPVAVVAIEVDPLLVDVNVHPTKREVRLSKEQGLSRLITKTISELLIEKANQSDALENVALDQTDTLVDQLKFNLNKDVVDTRRKVDEVHEQEVEIRETKPDNYVDLDTPREDERYILTTSWAKNVLEQTKLTPFVRTSNDEVVISQGDEILANNLPKLTYLGQTPDLILAYDQGNLFLVEQVAARRRLAFDRIKEIITGEKIAQQGLLTPLVLSFNNVDFLQIKDKLTEIAKIGLFLADFGDNSFILRSYPTWLSGDVESAVRQVLDSYLNVDHGDQQKLIGRIVTLQAKREISGHKVLKAAEASDLLVKLQRASDPYHDGEGNLIVVRISQAELHKMFKKDRR